MVACAEPVSLPKWFEERQIKHLGENVKYKEIIYIIFPLSRLEAKYNFSIPSYLTWVALNIFCALL